MFDRLTPILKGACLLLLLLLLYQVSRVALRKDPLADLNISALASQTSAGPAFVVPASAGSKQTTNSARVSPLSAPGRGAGGEVSHALPRETTKQPDFPAAIQARVDRINQSEIFGAVPRPMPMALLGIAGKDVFLRAPNGQTGLIRQGEELGGVKLLRIGVNRVLVEQDGQEKELMLFSGFGGEPLLPKGDRSPRELTTQP
jgi:hypothetical protein